MFSNTTHARAEKELVILVTPYLVAPMNAEDVPCLPGENVKAPNDLSSTCSIASKAARGGNSTPPESGMTPGTEASDASGEPLCLRTGRALPCE